MVSTASRNRTVDGEHGSETDEGAGEPDELEPDDVYHILQTSRRRDVLRLLHKGDEPVLLRDLAEQVAAREHGTSVENLTSDQRQRVYISLYQSHLPKLDNRGIVDYDKDRGTIELTPRASQFEPYLEDGEPSDPWPLRYAGTVACSGLFLVAVGGGIVSIPWTVASTIVLAAFAAATAVHAYSTGLVSGGIAFETSP